MKEALDFIKAHKEVAFATVENDIPKIRVFQIMKIEQSTLYFATAPHKEVYRQLINNPNVELLAMAGNISVRIGGKVIFDVSETMAQEIFATNPVLPRLYKTYKDLVYFKLPIAKLDYYDLSFTPPVFKHYNNG